MARILVVDDDRDILTLVERVFAHGGHVVMTSDNGHKALELLETVQFDCLISDAQMPNFSGFDLISTLRKNPRYANLGIAMLTGLRERKDIEKALKAGVDDYIVKPIDPLILTQKIEALFQKRPPEEHPEAVLGDRNPLAQAHIDTGMRIESVSELGIVLISNWPLTPGQVVDLKSPFFDEIECDVPPLKVLGLEPDKGDGSYRMQLIYLGAREAFLQKVRRYIFTHAGTNRANSKKAAG